MTRVRRRSSQTSGRRHRVGRRGAVVGVAAVAAISVGVVVASSSASGARYRTVKVTHGSVEQTVSYDGTVAAANRSDLVFATGGTVKRVTVGSGDEVEAGQTLATLETRGLRTAVTKARADLADAKAYLDDVEDGQIDTVTQAVTGMASASTASTTSSSTADSADATADSADSTVRLASYPASSASSVSAVAPRSSLVAASSTSDDLADRLAELEKEQKAVRTAQSAATEAIARAKDALATQQDACAAEKTSGGGTSEGEESGAGTSDEDASGSAGSDGSDDTTSGLSAACQQALHDVQDAQGVVADEQDALQAALEDLGSTLDEAVAQLGEDAEGSGSGDTGSESGTGSEQSGGGASDTGSKPGSGSDQGGSPSKGSAPDGGSSPNQSSPNQSSPNGSSPDQSAPSESSPEGAGGSGGSSGTEATAADLASAQADVDAKKASLAQARADLAAASLTAPFDATVMAVDVAAGDQVSTSDRALVLIGEGDTTANLSVPVDDLAAVEVGQSALVTPGVGEPVSGKVTRIGLLPESSDSTSSATTFQVTVRVDGELSSPEGSSVSVALVTATSADAVTVPTSAVTRLSDTTGTVLVVGDDGDAARTRVTLGALSGSKVAVTEGLEAGQEVAIADLDAALPGADSSDSERGGSFGGGLTGGGGGGFPGGGAGGLPGGGGGRPSGRG